MGIKEVEITYSLQGIQPLFDIFKVFLDVGKILREFGLGFCQKALVTSKARIQPLLYRVQLGQGFAELRGCKLTKAPK